MQTGMLTGTTITILKQTSLIDSQKVSTEFPNDILVTKNTEEKHDSSRKEAIKLTFAIRFRC